MGNRLGDIQFLTQLIIIIKTKPRIMEQPNLLQLFPALLPTEDASPIVKFIGNLGKGTLVYEPTLAKREKDEQNQHLYLCSTLPIKEGDWAMFGKHLGKVVRIYTDKENYHLLEFENSGVDVLVKNCVRVEFTTDLKLCKMRKILKTGTTDSPELGKIKSWTYGDVEVPAIDGNTKAISHVTARNGLGKVSFLEEYCKRYNQKGVDWESQRVAYGNSLREILEPELQKDNQKGDVEKLDGDKWKLTAKLYELAEGKIGVVDMLEWIDDYNQKGNQKETNSIKERSILVPQGIKDMVSKRVEEVDVEKLAEKYICDGKDFKAEGLSEYQNGKMNGFVDGYNQALQSNAGGFSLEEVKEIARKFTRAATPSKFIVGIDERFEQVWNLNFPKSLTPKQGEIEMWCEMEYLPAQGHGTVSQHKIKLINGEPVIYFK